MNSSRLNIPEEKGLTAHDIHAFLSDNIKTILDAAPSQPSLDAFKKSFYEWNDALNTCGLGKKAFDEKIDALAQQAVATSNEVQLKKAAKQQLIALQIKKLAANKTPFDKKELSGLAKEKVNTLTQEQLKKLAEQQIKPQLVLEESTKFAEEHYLECKFLLSLLLNAIYQARINKEPAPILRQLQQSFLCIAGASKNTALQNALFAAHVEHFSFVMDNQTSAPEYYLQSHIGFMLRAQKNGHFGDNNFNALRNRARQKTKIIEADQVDLTRYPEKDTLNKTNADVTLTLGDLHGNALKLLHFLIKYNIVDLKAGKAGEEKEKTQYMKFAAIYLKGMNGSPEELAKDKQQLQSIINNIQVIDRPAMLQFIGDMLCDRGGSSEGLSRGSDEWTLEILKKLQQEDVPFQIQNSNHDAEFLYGLSNGFSEHDCMVVEAMPPIETQQKNPGIIFLTCTENECRYKTHSMENSKPITKKALGLRDSEPFTKALLEKRINKNKILMLALKENDIQIINYKSSLKNCDFSLRNLIAHINHGLIKTSLPKKILEFVSADYNENPETKTQINALTAAFEIANLACTYYLPHLNLVNYHVDEKNNHINLYLHATAGITTVMEIAKQFKEALEGEKEKLRAEALKPQNTKSRIEIQNQLLLVSQKITALSVELVDSDLKTLAKTIDTINAEFQIRMADFTHKMNEIRKDFTDKINALNNDPDLNNPRKKQFIKNQLNRIIIETHRQFKCTQDNFNFLFSDENVNEGRGFTNPFTRLIWQRYYEETDLLSKVCDRDGRVKYGVGYIHGHGAWPKNTAGKKFREEQFPHVKNIETSLGKTGDTNIGTMLVAYETKSKYSPLQSLAVELLKEYLNLRISPDRKNLAQLLITEIGDANEPAQIIALLNQVRSRAMETDADFNKNKPAIFKRNQNGSRFHSVLNKIHTNLLCHLEENEINQVIHLEFQDLQNLLNQFDTKIASLYVFGNENNIEDQYKNMLTLMTTQFPASHSHYLHPQIKAKCALISSYLNLSNQLIDVKKPHTNNHNHIANMPRERSYYEKHPHIIHALIGVACVFGAILLAGGIAALLYFCLPTAPLALVAAAAIITKVITAFGLPTVAVSSVLGMAGLGVVGAALMTGIGAVGLKIKSFYNWCCCCCSPTPKSAEKPSISPSIGGGSTCDMQTAMPTQPSQPNRFQPCNPVVVADCPRPPQEPRRFVSDLWATAPAPVAINETPRVVRKKRSFSEP